MSGGCTASPAARAGPLPPAARSSSPPTPPGRAPPARAQGEPRHHAFSIGLAAAPAGSGAAAAQHRRGYARRQRQAAAPCRPSARQDHQEVHEVVERGDAGDGHERLLRRLARRSTSARRTTPARAAGRCRANGRKRMERTGLVSSQGSTNRMAMEAEHQHHAAQLVRHRAQDRVEGQEVPLRHDVRRRHQRVGRDVVVRVAQEVRREEHQRREDDQVDDDADAVLDRVVRVEGQGVLRPLRVDAERVVGAR